jgi:hypothetical protein
MTVDVSLVIAALLYGAAAVRTSRAGSSRSFWGVGLLTGGIISVALSTSGTLALGGIAGPGSGAVNSVTAWLLLWLAALVGGSIPTLLSLLSTRVSAIRRLSAFPQWAVACVASGIGMPLAFFVFVLILSPLGPSGPSH